MDRIVQEKGYGYNKLKYVEDYLYFEGGYKNTRVFFDSNGKPEQAVYTDLIFSPIFTSTYYLNSKGKIFKKEITTEKGVPISDETTYYDNKGSIVKTVHRYLDRHYITNPQLAETTHIVEYE